MTKPLTGTPHVDAAQLRAFKKLPMAEQLVEIWLNGRETNGSVAALKARVDEIEPRVDGLMSLEEDTNAVVKFIKSAGGVGNAIIITLVASFGTVIAAIQLWRH